MTNEVNIRPSKEFRKLLDNIRGRCMMGDKKVPSITEITKKIAEKIDEEKLWQDEYA